MDREDENESSDSNNTDKNACLPPRKKAKPVPAETYNDLHLRFTDKCKQYKILSKENLEMKQQLEQANQKIRSYGKLQASIQKLHKQALIIEKSNDREASIKTPKVFKYNGKDFFMEFDEYQKCKYRKQRNIVMSQLMQVVQLPMHKYCLPGERKCKRERLTNDMLQQIVRLAQDNFQVFKGDAFEQIKGAIGEVCRISASNSGTNEPETPTEEINGISD